jgi:hypothetical protein
LDWAWGKEAQFRSNVVPQVSLDGHLRISHQIKMDTSSPFPSISLTFWTNHPSWPSPALSFSRSSLLFQNTFVDEQPQKDTSNKKKQKYVPLYSKEGRDATIVKLSGKQIITHAKYPAVSVCHKLFSRRPQKTLLPNRCELPHVQAANPHCLPARFK